MKRTLTTAFATLGIVISGAVAAVMIVGVAEGIRQLPDPVASLLGAVVFLGAMGLAGRVAIDVGGPVALRGAALAGGLVLIGGWLATLATESNGEGLELTTVLQVVGGLIVMLTVSVMANHRASSSLRHRTTDRVSRP